MNSSHFFFLRQLNRRHVDGVGLYNIKKENKNFFLFHLVHSALCWLLIETSLWHIGKRVQKKSFGTKHKTIFPPLEWFCAICYVVFFLMSVNLTVTASIRWENCFSVETTGCCWFRWITRVGARSEGKSLFKILAVYKDEEKFFSYSLALLIW